MLFETVETCQEHNTAQDGLVLGTPYRELHHIAEQHLRREPLRYLWSPAALINESYIRLAGRGTEPRPKYDDMRSLWSRIMRNVLIDNARSFRASKRNEGRTDDLSACQPPAVPQNLDLAIGLNVAIRAVCPQNSRMAQVLRMRFRDGFTLDETANTLKLSQRTVQRVLRAARVELLAALG